MEETISNWHCYLRTHDQDSIHSEEINSQDWRGEEKVERVRIEGKVIEIITGSAEETAFNWVREDVASVRVESPAKAATDRNNERIDRIIRVDDEWVHNRVGETAEVASIIQEKVLLPEEKSTASKRR